jgi:glucosamine-phosphate N-acetyltransferase
MSIPAFPQVLIGDSVQSQLPNGFKIRPLHSTDYEKGYLETLSHLTTVGALSKAQFMGKSHPLTVDRFNYLKQHQYEYYVIVIEDEQEGRIAAAGTVFVERKFVHANGLVGHIEDIVVNEKYRKLHLGKKIIEQLKVLGHQAGCYKIILDCSEKNVPFYIKCGFEKKGFEMAWYIPEDKAKL